MDERLVISRISASSSSWPSGGSLRFQSEVDEGSGARDSSSFPEPRRVLMCHVPHGPHFSPRSCRMARAFRLRGIMALRDVNTNSPCSCSLDFLFRSPCGWAIHAAAARVLRDVALKGPDAAWPLPPTELIRFADREASRTAIPETWAQQRCLRCRRQHHGDQAQGFRDGGSRAGGEG